MKKQVSRISVLQSAKVLTVLYAIFGLIYTLISIPMMIFGHAGLKMVGIFYFFGPIWMGVIGFIGFVIFAGLYNWLADRLGGVEFEVVSKEEQISV